MSGWLRVVGIGPGPADWITPEASAALAAASDIVGYSSYLERLALAPNQRCHVSGNGDELERATQALELALSGAQVAVISGGDPGVFAMASAVFEA
ncbi:MAG TPA: SAM-dependent methyltransferase, partial [Polyangiales bacterium]|nr:SAM-dependent methyltransferase [Polyangiales bacterium]